MLSKDPVILLSYVNMKLRDGCGGLEELCAQEGAEPEELTARLESAGFCYDPEQNQFK